MFGTLALMGALLQQGVASIHPWPLCCTKCNSLPTRANKQLCFSVYSNCYC